MTAGRKLLLESCGLFVCACRRAYFSGAAPFIQRSVFCRGHLFLRRQLRSCKNGEANVFVSRHMRRPLPRPQRSHKSEASHAVGWWNPEVTFARISGARDQPIGRPDLTLPALACQFSDSFFNLHPLQPLHLFIQNRMSASERICTCAEMVRACESNPIVQDRGGGARRVALQAGCVCVSSLTHSRTARAPLGRPCGATRLFFRCYLMRAKTRGTPKAEKCAQRKKINNKRKEKGRSKVPFHTRENPLSPQPFPRLPASE